MLPSSLPSSCGGGPASDQLPHMFLFCYCMWFNLSRALLKLPCTLFIAPVSMLVVEFWHANVTVVSVW